MDKLRNVLLCTIIALILTSVLSCAPDNTKGSSYGEDRALIEDLQARYMFALDFRDADTYALTFTEDGVLDSSSSKVSGRDKIREFVIEMTQRAQNREEESSELPPVVSRHIISNVVIKIDGDKALGRAYWVHYGNSNPERKVGLDAFGHYEDEMVKVDGEWLFSSRKIYNEQFPGRSAKGDNPSW